MKLKVEYIPIDELKPYENNAKIHTDEQQVVIVGTYGKKDLKVNQ